MKHSLSTNNYRVKKGMIIGIGILCFVFLILFILSQLTNNLNWLQGTWESADVKYHFTSKEGKCKNWNIKKNKSLVFHDGQVTVNSNKKQIILSSSDDKLQYSIDRVGRDEIEVVRIMDGHRDSRIQLKKVKE